MEEREVLSICHVTSMHDWNDDRIFERACVGLANQGHKVYLIATDAPPGEVNDVEMHSLKHRTGISRRLYSSYEAFRSCLAIEADIFHFHDPDLLPWMRILAGRGRKVVYDVHENYNERILSSGLWRPLKKIASSFWTTFERYCSRSFSGIITTTISMQALFDGLKTPKSAVSNTPYLFTLKEVELLDTKMPLSIYTSGTNSSKRNCLQTVEAMPKILETIPDAKMYFAGRYEPESYLDELKNKAVEIGVDEHVIFEGMKSWKDNFVRTSGMEIGCVFYEDNANNRVTIPNRLFEYMYAGAAVLGESFPEIKRVVEHADCGICIDSRDPDKIANGVIELFKDQAQLRQMQLKGKKAVESTFSFENELNRMIDFYKTL